MHQQPTHSDSLKTIIIGFSGKRELDDPDLIQTRIEETLSRLKKEHGSEVNYLAISSVAAGADVLFCETARKLGIPLLVCLPFSEEYFEQDFKNEFADWWERSKSLIEECRQRRTLTVSPAQITRSESFIACGRFCVDESTVFLAVGNEEKVTSREGASAMIQYARETGRPVIAIDPKSAKVKWLDVAAKTNTSEAPTPATHETSTVPLSKFEYDEKPTLNIWRRLILIIGNIITLGIRSFVRGIGHLFRKGKTEKRPSSDNSKHGRIETAASKQAAKLKKTLGNQAADVNQIRHAASSILLLEVIGTALIVGGLVLNQSQTKDKAEPDEPIEAQSATAADHEPKAEDPAIVSGVQKGENAVATTENAAAPPEDATATLDESAGDADVASENPSETDSSADHVAWELPTLKVIVCAAILILLIRLWITHHASNYRVQAEAFRAVYSLMRAGVPFPHTAYKRIEQFDSGLKNALLALRTADLWEGKPALTDLETSKKRYREWRLDDQLNYYKEKSAEAKPWASWLTYGYRSTLIGVFVIATAYLIYTLMPHDKAGSEAASHSSEIISNLIFYFLPALLAGLGTFFMASLSIHELSRRTNRFKAAAEFLDSYVPKLERCSTYSELTQTIEEIESYLLEEVFAWRNYSLFVNTH